MFSCSILQAGDVGDDDDCDGFVDGYDPDCPLQPCGADECPNGFQRLADSLCHSHCEDGYRDYSESDVDCGGGDCPRCEPGRSCLSGFDCASGNCIQNVCR